MSALEVGPPFLPVGRTFPLGSCVYQSGGDSATEGVDVEVDGCSIVVVVAVVGRFFIARLSDGLSVPLRRVSSCGVSGDS